MIIIIFINNLILYFKGEACKNSFFLGFNTSYDKKQELILMMVDNLKTNLSLSNLVSLSEAEFIESLTTLKENFLSFKKSNEIDEEFVK